MNTLGGLAAVLAISLATTAHASGQKNQCVANMAATAEANGDAVDAEAVCACMKAEMDANPALLNELIAAGGMPSPEEASDAFKKMFRGCRAKAS